MPSLEIMFFVFFMAAIVTFVLEIFFGDRLAGKLEELEARIWDMYDRLARRFRHRRS